MLVINMVRGGGSDDMPYATLCRVRQCWLKLVSLTPVRQWGGGGVKGLGGALVGALF